MATLQIPEIGSVTLYGCNSISYDESANIIPLPMPTGDSSETEVFDMLGVVRTVSANGSFADDGNGTAQAKANALLALTTGDQALIVFTDQFGDSLTVMVSSVSIVWDLPGFQCTWSLKMVRGTAI